MSWTYDLTTALGQVRFLIGDTLNDALTNSDDEITFCLTQNNNDIYRAGAYACRRWASKLVQDLSIDQGTRGWKLDRNEQVKNLRTLALDLEKEAVIVSGITPYAGGISISDKQAVEGDTDRVQPGNTVTNHRSPGLPTGGDGTNQVPTNLGWPIW